MTYEIVNLKEKTLVGLSARTQNDSPDMGAVIGGLWRTLFEEKVFFTIPHKVNTCSIGLYSDYAFQNNAYSVTVGCEVSKVDNLPENTVVKTIPSGRYAKFVIFGDMVAAVSAAWQTIWQMPLERSFTGDFEEYISMNDHNECEVHIYIALK